jgi:hypothetical protein
VHRVRKVCRSAAHESARVDVREPVVDDVVAARVVWVDDRLDGGQRRQPLDEDDAHVDARDVLLDDGAVRVLHEQVFEHARELGRILDDVLLADPLAGSLEVRFDNRGEGELVEAAVLERAPRDEAPGGARNAKAGELLFGERLVQRHAKRVRVASGRRDAELLEEGRVEGASRLAAVPLREVERDVGRERL